MTGIELHGIERCTQHKAHISKVVGGDYSHHSPIIISNNSMAVLELETEEDAEEELESLVVETAAGELSSPGGGSSSNNNNLNNSNRDAQLQARLKRRTAAVLPRPGGDQLQESSRRMLLSRFLLFLLLALAVWRLIAKEEKEDSLIPGEETNRGDNNEPPVVVVVEKKNTFSAASWLNNDAIRPLSPTALNQAANYRNHTGLMLNLHITHHAGTTLCAAIGRAPGIKAPDFACNNQRNDPLWRVSKKGPWRGHNETAAKIHKIRQEDGLQMVSWEFRQAPRDVPLAETEWEHPDLVSVFIARDPMTRLLAADGLVTKFYPGLLNAASSNKQRKSVNATSSSQHKLWEAYAHDDRFTNNFALRVLAGNGCCQGNETTVQHLQAAKELLKRFTVVLDIVCLNQGIEALAQLLGISKLGPIKPVKAHDRSPRERIGHDDIYEYLLERNQMDIRLYEWTKSISLVDCSKLETA